MFIYDDGEKEINKKIVKNHVRHQCKPKQEEGMNFLREKSPWNHFTKLH